MFMPCRTSVVVCIHVLQSRHILSTILKCMSTRFCSTFLCRSCRYYAHILYTLAHTRTHTYINLLITVHIISTKLLICIYATVFIYIVRNMLFCAYTRPAMHMCDLNRHMCVCVWICVFSDSNMSSAMHSYEVEIYQQFCFFPPLLSFVSDCHIETIVTFGQSPWRCTRCSATGSLAFISRIRKDGKLECFLVQICQEFGRQKKANKPESGKDCLNASMNNGFC